MRKTIESEAAESAQLIDLGPASDLTRGGEKIAGLDGIQLQFRPDVGLSDE